MDVRTGRRDLAWLGGLVVLLLVVFLWPYVVGGYRFGVARDRYARPHGWALSRELIS